ncbi:Ankyrin repeat and SOCS box protein [Penicillium chrysogenum]|jgi:ankyrin repeat protein|uniref:Pc22g17980 protein n=2 Tax=Penicillium chrysogenum species complex TaxID=254878 RepID=B6HTQ1_PENRW|nr:Ankyrin repeat and SOCS box protein [Penicillium chrysogenum]CAP99086.1 Pc22g17980 [Penicillium rubens Wisconsin 54-1255]
MPTLSEFPNELLLEISLRLDYPGLNAFTRVCRHFHALSNRVLYRTIAKDSPGKAIAWATKKEKETSARKLLQMCGMKILDDIVFGREPIVIAASNGHTHLVELFLPHCIHHDTEKGGDLYKKALTKAIEKEHVEVVKLLLEHKTHTNSQDRYAAIPLCRAVRMRHVPIVRLLLEHNYCNLDAYDMYDMTPLALAAAAKASSTNLEIAKLLVEAGADSHIEHGLLLRAAKSYNLPVMKLLLANNFDWRRLEWFDVLREFSRPIPENYEVGELLLSGMNVDRILSYGNAQRCFLLRGAIANHLDDLLEKILNEWPVLDENHKPSRRAIRFCPLSLAVCNGRPSAVKLLLEHGADPGGELDCPPVQFALEQGKDAMAKLLFDKGATFDPETCHESSGYRRLLKLRMARVQRVAY